MNNDTLTDTRLDKDGELVISVKQGGEIQDALNRNGFTRELVKELTKGDNLTKVRMVLQGLCEIRHTEHVVDLGADAVIPKDYKWTVEEHRKGKPAKLERKADGLYLDGKKIDFWLSEEQKRKQAVVGNILRAKLKEMPVLNDNVLNYLLKNPHLIPEDWKKDENGNTRYIFFWGTIFRGAGGLLYVRYLYWYGGEWVWHYFWLGNGWNSDYPAAVSAS
jgi:hypothetical protein